jgi:putative oxidoreductase
MHSLEAAELANDSTSFDGGQEMDSKRVVQFALLGSSDWEQYAILLVRVSIGLFFAISGGNKLFVAGGTKPVYETLVKAKAPFPHQLAYFVSGVEFVGGSLLAVGFLSSPASLASTVSRREVARVRRGCPRGR